MKRIRPNIFFRIIRGWQAGVYALFGLASLVALLIVLFKINQYCWFKGYFALILILLISVLVSFFAGDLKMLPSIVIDELSNKENSYTSTFCDWAGLREADEMTKPYYGSGFIPFDQIEQWRLKNPKGFVQIKNSQGELCACFVILGLTNSFFDQFLQGRVSEHDIRSDDVLNIESTIKLDRIYISGVVVRDPNSYMGCKRANVMLWTILQYINKIFGLRKIRSFYAVAITPESEKLLKALNFDLIGNKNTRKDQSNLYKIELDKKNWNSLLSRLGDYSRMVKLNFE